MESCETKFKIHYNIYFIFAKVLHCVNDFLVLFLGLLFLLVFFFFEMGGDGGKGVNKHVQHYYAKVGRRKTARSFLTDSDHQKIRNATDTFHLDFLGNPALKKKNYKVSTIIN